MWWHVFFSNAHLLRIIILCTFTGRPQKNLDKHFLGLNDSTIRDELLWVSRWTSRLAMISINQVKGRKCWKLPISVNLGPLSGSQKIIRGMAKHSYWALKFRRDFRILCEDRSSQCWHYIDSSTILLLRRTKDNSGHNSPRVVNYATYQLKLYHGQFHFPSFAHLGGRRASAWAINVRP